jgi:hypothetical protein
VPRLIGNLAMRIDAGRSENGRMVISALNGRVAVRLQAYEIQNKYRHDRQQDDQHHQRAQPCTARLHGIG